MHGTGVWLGCVHPAARRRPRGHAARAASLDAHELLATVERAQGHRADDRRRRFAKPIIRALDEAKPGGGAVRHLVASKMIISSGVMWTAEVKEELLDRIEQVVLLDAIGSSEGVDGHAASR